MLKNRLVQIIIIILAGIGLVWGINAVLILNVTGEAIQPRVHSSSTETDNPASQLSMNCSTRGTESLILIYEQPGTPPVFQFVFFDFDQPTLSVINIPGNLPVRSRILPQNTEEAIPLDAAYQELKTQHQDVNTSYGIVSALTAQILFENLNITADHYVVLHSNAFHQLTEILGGVQMTLPYPVPLPGTSLVLESGNVILTPEIAQQMALWTPTGHPETDQLVMERVMLMTRGIARQMEANGGDSLRRMALETLDAVIHTDMKAETFSRILCVLAWLPDETIQLSAPTPEWFFNHMMNH